ncbi:hypothetical protein JQK15_20090 [Sphingobium sp. BHU LFT2]|uniref:lysozyme inhibitor LprI family protein n=1 Tax=Sphingobium sp. BHU LFT2 TaxID=2807634 RepID=UPI001BECD571|nr:hypothetical protein [Sphingobium sp. BHU LFT2]MBT2245818.1 hypothetical protein [Sphingobium sp. BHU LFT2]
MTKSLAALAIAVALAVPHAPVAAQRQGSSPSFDCGKARSPVERAICASGEAARLDWQIGEQFGLLTRLLDKGAAAALREDQRVFITVRDELYEPTESGRTRLLAQLRARRDLLAGIVVPPEGSRSLEGRWRNIAGEAAITKESDGTLSLGVNTAEPTTGRWVCELGGVIEGGFVSTSSDMIIEPRRVGAALKIEEHSSPNKRGTRDYCGLNGYVEGTYFLWRKP